MENNSSITKVMAAKSESKLPFPWKFKLSVDLSLKMPAGGPIDAVKHRTNMAVNRNIARTAAGVNLLLVVVIFRGFSSIFSQE